jgi:hypothetical protein
MHYTTFSQTDLDKEYQDCLNGSASIWGNVGAVGDCHAANAGELTASSKLTNYNAAIHALQRPLMPTFVLLIVVCAAWIVIPLADRQKTA